MFLIVLLAKCLVASGRSRILCSHRTLNREDRDKKIKKLKTKECRLY